VSTFTEKVLNLPAVPGVYLFKDATGRVLYVGKAKSLAQRVRSYLADDLANPRLSELMSRASDLDAILTDTEVEAVLLESTLIRQHRPHYNILLKDDKSFPYVRISVQEEFPRVSVTRRVRRDGARYLGPYADVKRLRRTLRQIRPIFPLRSCRNFEEYRKADRPCLYYHIRRCVGPCHRRASVDPADYRRRVEGLILFLLGRDHELRARLREEMEQSAAARRYERAAECRDQLELLEGARVPQDVITPGGRDTDVVGLARVHGRAAVAVLVRRAGRVVAKESRLMERADGRDDAALLESFLSQHYLPRTELPRRIVLGSPPAGAEVLGAALGLSLLFGIPLGWGAAIAVVAAFCILALQSFGFRRLEAVIAVFVGVIVIAFAFELLAVTPDPSVMADQLFSPHIHGEAVLLAVGIVGATVMPHVIYLHSALTQSRVRGVNDAELRQIQRFERIDVLIAMSIAGLVNLSMLAIFATRFFGTGADSIEDAYHGLHADPGKWAAVLLGIALLSSGLSSSSVGTLAGQIVMQGFIQRTIPVFARRAITAAPALAVALAGVDPSRALVLSQVVLSFGIPFALIPLVLFTSKREVMGNLVNNGLTSFAAWAIAVVISGLNVFLLVETFR